MRLAARIVAILAVYADAWAAAGLYEELSRLLKWERSQS